MDILEFYGLKEDPFRLTPDPFYFFPSVTHKEALMSMNYVVEQKEGFCLVTGAPGTGKTTLLNVFKKNWEEKSEIALILTPRLSPDEFLLSVLEDLGVKPQSTNKNDILKAFRDFLIEKSTMGKPVIIIVDEAQNLPDETIEELRLLSNLETEKDKLLQIILISQPELELRLKDKLRQLDQRITVRSKLSTLLQSEILEYINFRLIKAGKGFLKFEDKLSRPIYKFSKGIPRIINLLSSRAIMSAYIEGSNVVTKKHLRYAMMHLKDLAPKKVKRLFLTKRLTYAASFLVILTIGGSVGYHHIDTLKGLPGFLGYTTVEHSNVESSKETPAQDIKIVEEKKEGKTITVVTAAANLRPFPSFDFQPIAWAQKGAVFEVLDELELNGKKWYKVRLPDSREPWIAGSVVKLLTH